jgi:hypothetical protein
MRGERGEQGVAVRAGQPQLAVGRLAGAGDHQRVVGADAAQHVLELRPRGRGVEVAHDGGVDTVLGKLLERAAALGAARVVPDGDVHAPIVGIAAPAGARGGRGCRPGPAYGRSRTTAQPSEPAIRLPVSGENTCSSLSRIRRCRISPFVGGVRASTRTVSSFSDADPPSSTVRFP